jgi:HlyD family secretion protein
MKNITTFKIIGLSAIFFFLYSCKEEVQPDAYGNFEEDAVTVSAESAGKIIWYKVEDGMVLKKGEKVAVLDTTQLHYKKESLEAAMDAVKAKAAGVLSQKDVLQEQLDVALTEQERIHRLFNAKAATKQQKDDIDGQVRVLKQKIRNVNIQYRSVMAENKKLEVEIGSVDDLIRKCIIVSPVNGTVLVSFAKESEFTAPGKPLFDIQDVSDLILRAYVTETQLASVKVGQKVTVEVDNEKGTDRVTGVVTWVSDRAEFTPKQIQTKDERRNLVYAVKIKVPNTDRKLKIGMPADVYFK